MIELMTIGYEGMKPERFLELLKRCHVDRIVDVRELAISRRPGYSKAALAAMLAMGEIGYIHLPALGCPRNIRHGYREDGDWALYTKRFCAYLMIKEDEMAKLRGIVERERCCLLCYEADFNFCHRLFVAERLACLTGGMIIKHLTGPIRGRVVERPALVTA